MARFVAAIDQGTASTRCIIFNQIGPVATAQQEHRQIFPSRGWVEHDPIEIWHATQELIAQAIATAGAKPGEIAALGITNQRETTVVWDRNTGLPLCNAIVWQDTRTKPICDDLAKDGGIDRFRPRHRPAPGNLFLRARSCDGFSTTSPMPAPRPKGRCPLRHHRLLAHLESHRRKIRRPTRHGRHQRQPHHAHESQNPPMGSTG